MSVQVASKQGLSSDKKLQLIFTLSKITEHHSQLQQVLPSDSNQGLQEFVANIKNSVEHDTLSQRDPDNLFQEASQIINQLFAFINNRLNQLKETLH